MQFVQDLRLEPQSNMVVDRMATVKPSVKCNTATAYCSSSTVWRLAAFGDLRIQQSTPCLPEDRLQPHWKRRNVKHKCNKLLNQTTPACTADSPKRSKSSERDSHYLGQNQEKTLNQLELTPCQVTALFFSKVTYPKMMPVSVDATSPSKREGTLFLEFSSRLL